MLLLKEKGLNEKDTIKMVDILYQALTHFGVKVNIRSDFERNAAMEKVPVKRIHVVYKSYYRYNKAKNEAEKMRDRKVKVEEAKLIDIVADKFELRQAKEELLLREQQRYEEKKSDIDQRYRYKPAELANILYSGDIISAINVSGSSPELDKKALNKEKIKKLIDTINSNRSKYDKLVI